VVLAEFDALCNRPVGAADYVALTQHFHTLCLSAVPQRPARQPKLKHTVSRYNI
jgi:predicted ATPase